MESTRIDGPGFDPPPPMEFDPPTLTARIYDARMRKAIRDMDNALAAFLIRHGMPITPDILGPGLA